MFNFKRGTAALIVTAAVTLTGFAGTAGAQQDLRNADQQAPAPAAPTDRIHQDLRNADQRASLSHVLPTQGQDFRNADRRAPAVLAPSESTGVSLPAETIDGAPVIQVPQHGFDWGDAGIGAAGMLALFSIAAGSALLLTGRKRRRGVKVATH
jgi:hypothetical protein